MRRPTSLTTVLLLLAGLLTLGGVDPAAAATARRIVYTRWDSGAQLRTGTADGVRVSAGRLLIDPATAGRVRAGGTAYDVGRWRSPWTAPGFTLTRLIASWSAATPGDSRIRVEVRGRTASATSSWDTLGIWAAGDRYFHRTTVSGQSDDLGSVAVDTWRTAGVAAYQLRVSLMRRAGTTASPSVGAVGAVASRLPGVDDVATSHPGVARGVVLPVPRYSQMVHAGDYPRYGGGGEAWCSPTSTSMVLGYYSALPRPAAYSWVGSHHVDPWVDHAARMTYDYGYAGTGNWPFNTAYAARLAGHAFVTRLRSLREAERFIAAGIPLVASIAFGRGELDGAPISSTNGHLLVIAGFTASGDVVVNDPAASTRRGVRRTYDRGQFEDAWLPASGGTVYVIRDAAHPLPGGDHSNW